MAIYGALTSTHAGRGNEKAVAAVLAGLSSLNIGSTGLPRTELDRRMKRPHANAERARGHEKMARKTLSDKRAADTQSQVWASDDSHESLRGQQSDQCTRPMDSATGASNGNSAPANVLRTTSRENKFAAPLYTRQHQQTCLENPVRDQGSNGSIHIREGMEMQQARTHSHTDRQDNMRQAAIANAPRGRGGSRGPVKATKDPALTPKAMAMKRHVKKGGSSKPARTPPDESAGSKGPKEDPKRVTRAARADNQGEVSVIIYNQRWNQPKHWALFLSDPGSDGGIISEMTIVGVVQSRAWAYNERTGVHPTAERNFHQEIAVGPIFDRESYLESVRHTPTRFGTSWWNAQRWIIDVLDRLYTHGVLEEHSWLTVSDALPELMD